MSAAASKRAIIAALLANAGIAVAKFVGFLITQSSSMLAESVHSVADTSNQALLLWGQREANKEPDALHQFGYGRSRSRDPAAGGDSSARHVIRNCRWCCWRTPVR